MLARLLDKHSDATHMILFNCFQIWAMANILLCTVSLCFLLLGTCDHDSVLSTRGIKHQCLLSVGAYYPDLWYHPACSGSDMMVLELLVVYTLPSHLLFGV